MVWFGIKGKKLLQQLVANGLLLVMLFGLFQSIRITDPDRSTTFQIVESVAENVDKVQVAGSGRLLRKDLQKELHARFQLGRIQFHWDTETGFDVLYLFYTLVAYFFVYTVRTKLNEPT